MRIAQEHPGVLADPAPRVLFTGFGESSLDFEVRVYIGTIDDYLPTLDGINNMIDQEFRKAAHRDCVPAARHSRAVDSSGVTGYQGEPGYGALNGKRCLVSHRSKARWHGLSCVVVV